MIKSKNKYRVMHVVDSLGIGGMENGVVNILNIIDKNKFNLSLCCLSEPGPFSGRIMSDSISIFSMNRKGGFQPSLFFCLARLFRNEKIDIVHTHGWLTYLYGCIAAKMAGSPVFINGEHGTFHLGKLRRRVAYKIISILVDRFITVSDSLKLDLQNDMHIKENKIICIQNGVDMKRFSSGSAKDVEPIKTEYGIPVISRVIGSVGRLEPVKNYELLIRAFALLKDKFNDLYCVLAGDGSCRESLEKLCVELNISDKVYFIGNVDSVQNVIAIMDVFVLSSISEGMSNTILEAMAGGKPVVATRVGGNNELVKDGYNGYLVSSQNKGELADSIKKVLDDDAIRLSFGAASRKMVEKNHTLEVMVKAYEMVYIQCMKDKWACK